MARQKRVVVINDPHCGHLAGLTPPLWQSSIKKKTEETVIEGEPVVVDNTKHNKWAYLQREIWDEYEKIIESLQPIDVLIVNADCIDGKGLRSGGAELITSDRNKQVEMAGFCIRQTKAKKIVMTYGTPYHTGTDEDWEDNVAKAVGATKIGSHEWIDVNGLIFDVKHKIGSSGIPHGRFTAIAKDKLWNTLWAERKMQPKAHVFLRAHVHYFGFCGGPDWLGITLPALQGMGSKFGGRQMSGCVDWGLVYFDIKSKSEWTWNPVIREIKCQRTKAIKL